MNPERRPAADPVEDYLDQLYASLRTTPRQARRIIAEAEDHLREATAAGIEAGLTEVEAQEAAISSFGSVRAVVRAHARRVPPLAVFGELVMAGWKLASIAVLAVAGSGVIAFAMNRTLGRSFVGGSTAQASGASAATCQHWMGLWPHVQYCGQAAVLETSSDAVSLRLLMLIPGLVLLEGYLLARRYQRRRGWRADLLPDLVRPHRGRLPVRCAHRRPGLPGRRGPAHRHPDGRPRQLPVGGRGHPAHHGRLRARAPPRPAPARLRLRTAPPLAVRTASAFTFIEGLCFGSDPGLTTRWN